MAKLSEIITKIDAEAKEGNRAKALAMLEKLLEKVPDNKSLLTRKQRFSKELETDKRIKALEKKYGAAAK